VLAHKFLQNILLLLLIGRGFPHLFLPLIKHHLLDHLSRISVQVTERRVLRCDFGRIDLGGRGDDVGPPFHFVGFVEVDGEFFASGGGLEGPG
jgi:hypothetical protein